MCLFQANLAVQEARLAAAMADLNKAQAQLDEKEQELAEVRAQYEEVCRIPFNYRTIFTIKFACLISKQRLPIKQAMLEIMIAVTMATRVAGHGEEAGAGGRRGTLP